MALTSENKRKELCDTLKTTMADYEQACNQVFNQKVD